MVRKMALLGIIPALLAGLMVIGGCKRPSPDNIADKIVNELVAKLDLTIEQQATLNATKIELLGKLGEIRKSRETTHDEALAELGKENFDQEKLKKIVAGQRKQRDEIADFLIDRLLKFHATLTAEQKVKLTEFLKDKEKQRRHFFDN